MMTTEQVDLFARGLYHVAKAGGVQEEELALIGEFLEGVAPRQHAELAHRERHSRG